MNQIACIKYLKRIKINHSLFECKTNKGLVNITADMGPHALFHTYAGPNGWDATLLSFAKSLPFLFYFEIKKLTAPVDPKSSLA